MGCVHGKCYCHCTPSISDEEGQDYRDIGPHSTTSILENHRHILTESSVGFVPVPSHNFHLQYSFLTQRGYYPDSPDKENQDSFCIHTRVQGNPNLHFFGVFDGHGQFGTQCSNFVRDRLINILGNDPTLADDPKKAYDSAFLATNSELHDSEIDDSLSGTTAITILVSGNTLFVANVGDSRAVMGVRSGNSVLAEDLSIDQTPFRQDEYERVKLCGARVLTIDQVEGVKDPDIQSWGDEESDEGDPPRLWVQNGMYPGTAFTRSVGDATAEKIGVIADPEVSMVHLTPDHLFFVVASDGVFEFLNSQAVVNMVVKFADPRDACAAIAAESYQKWLEHENRTDDITIIIVHIKDLCNSGAGATDRAVGTNTKTARLVVEKGPSERLVFRKSEDYPCTSGRFSELQPCPHDLPTELSLACVAQSPSPTKSSETISRRLGGSDLLTMVAGAVWCCSQFTIRYS
ncbi:probable protein phosphatase 2C 35 [Magnolia sinica]|uniref:probable protein phosphatase 2C 35 n=1 Tax=Magnolia sinica TaxID=86752 RepID=UPI00265B5E28|nr:probable protein phosphatase 2C 35 [Magnolia sinica]